MTEKGSRQATDLLARLQARIAADGPIPLDAYMAACLTDPAHGYYLSADPFGRGGDFVTAPEVSQLFGEIVGAWCAHMWEAIGRPAPVPLIELGPGRGTLMADMLRAARALPAFAEAIEVHLVEASPKLRAVQAASLAPLGAAPLWHDDLDAIPPGPCLVVANEFFDALPIRQHVRRAGTWRERAVGLDDAGTLCWTEIAPRQTTAELDAAFPDVAEGTIVETSPARTEMARQIARRLAQAPGVALIIDYGYAGPIAGDSFQAVRRHAYADPLKAPGEADLTAHVDFAALAESARKAGAAAFGPLPQGMFLEQLGIALRADRLAAARPDKRAELEAGLSRLVSPDQMGSLFKCLALASLGLPAPPPFAAGNAAR